MVGYIRDAGNLVDWATDPTDGTHHAGVTGDEKLLCIDTNSVPPCGAAYDTWARVIRLPWPARAVRYGGGFGAVVRADGGAVCTWGDPANGRLGRPGTGRDPLEVIGLPSDDPIAILEAGPACVVLITQSGQAYGWGNDSLGQLARGSSADRSTPLGSPQLLPHLSGRGICRLAIGRSFAVAETTARAMLIWGQVREPRLSLGFMVDVITMGHDRPGLAAMFCHWTPEPLAAEQVEFPLRSLSAGPAHAAAADARGRVWVWDGRGERRFHTNPLPGDLPGPEGAVRVATADSMTVALTESGRLWEVRFAGSRLTCRNVSGEVPRGLSPCNGAHAVMLVRLVPREEDTCAVIRSGGRDFSRAELSMLLSDAGISAESAIELLRAPPAGVFPASAGPLQVYAAAPQLGRADPVCVEVAADATLGGLAAAAAQQLQVS